MDHASRLSALGDGLARHRAYWQPSAFTTRELEWQQQQPALWHWLQSLSDADVDILEAQPERLVEQLSRWIDELDAVQRCVAVPALPDNPLRFSIAPQRLDTGVPGRKWQQVQAFAAKVPREPDALALPLLDWCAGKGHLGRLLALTHRRPVTGLEWDPALCAAGNDLSARFAATCHLHQQDVLAREAADWIAGSAQVVALHACGDLHERLLRLVCQHGLPALSLSPCCYHRRADAIYRPFSNIGRRNDLGLSRQELRLCVQESVTAGRRVRRLRDVEVAWRLGFDELQRQVRGTDHYLPVAVPPKAILSGRFSDFCHWAAQAKQLHLPSMLALDAFEARGWQRLHTLRRQELVAHVFRRPLELWLVLDRVCFLEESGYSVELGTFCERALTPRNLMINARAPA